MSALHQTGTHVRPNGSIKDEDIQLYLKSRFGIVVTLEQVRSTILHGFAGGDEGTLDATEVIDMMELTAIILIPLLLKASIVEGDGGTLPEGVLPPPENLLKDVIEMIVHDSGASAFAATDGATLVTADLIKNIFSIYGEWEMSNDEELIQEMFDACKDDFGEDGQLAFAPRSFGRALTRDVTLFDLTNETKASTIIEDVFGHGRQMPTKDYLAAPAPLTPADEVSGGKLNSSSSLDLDNRYSESMSHLGSKDAPQGAVVEVANKGQEINNIKRVYTAPAIDVQAGTYRSKTLIVTLWGSVLFQLIKVALESQPKDPSCAELYVLEGSLAENMAGMGCEASISVVTWLIRFLIFCALGLLMIGMGGLGNYVGNTRWYLSFVGLVCALFGKNCYTMIGPVFLMIRLISSPYISTSRICCVS